MPRSVCLFGELDTYSSSIPQTIEALPLLIEQLKTACLLYDEVIVNTNVLLDHALTLPAFQTLSCFTKAGLLWTTASENQAHPESYILNRVQKLYGDNLNEGISKRASERLERLIESWQNISPNKWRVVRKLSQQQNNATSNIFHNVKNLPSLSKQGIEVQSYLLDMVAHMQDQGIFDRNAMISQLGGMREQLSNKELSQLALIVQGEHMNQAAHNKGDINISLFPGEYIQYLRKNNFLFQAQSLPMELNIIDKANYRLYDSGFPLKKMTALPQDQLYLLSQSSDWKIWRNYLLSDDFSFESVKEMKSLKRRYQRLEKVLSILLKNIDQISINLPEKMLLPAPWLSSGLGLMGAITKTKKEIPEDNIIVLNLSSRKIIYKQQQIILEKSYVTLLSLLASTGNIGMPVETLKQLDIEVDLIKRDYDVVWRPQKNDKEELDDARLNRLNVTKYRLNKKLKILGIAIQVEALEGIWRIISLKTQFPLLVTLKGTSWMDIDTQENVLEPYKGLTKTQKLIWNYCIRQQATFVSAKAIAIEIDSPDKSTKQISDIMYKFKQKISDSPYQLIRSYQGEYMLIKY